MKLISVQSRDNRIATIESIKYQSQIDGEFKHKYRLYRKEIKRNKGVFGVHLVTCSETTEEIAFSLARKWVDEGKY